MDSFFASVEERNRPYLKGMPIAVGSDPEGGMGRGVISTANYPARAYGIRSATPIRLAWKLSEDARKKGLPPVTFIEGDYHKYEGASKEVFSIIKKRFSHVEQIGIDEGYIDCTSYKSYAKAQRAMQELKSMIRKKTGLPCSVGIAPSKMFAKIASELEKPDGLVVLTPKRVAVLLPTLSIGTLPGVGRKTEEVFLRKGIKTVADARKLQWDELVDLFGTHGFSMYERIWGTDDRKVESEKADAKSIGDEITLRHDISDFKESLPIIEKEAATLIARMKAQGFVGAQTVTCVVRLSDFTTFTRSVTAQEMVCDQKSLSTIAIKLILPSFDKRDNPRRQKIRLIGLRLTKLVRK